MGERAEQIRVLHVDDDPEYVETAASMLERADERLTVRAVTGPAEALSALDNRRVDCVVSDYAMPKLNGLELLERVRSEYGDVPFVMLTGRGDEDIASEAVSNDVTEYFPKAADATQYPILANRISNVVQARRDRRRAERLSRINALLRELDRQLVDARTRPVIERVVCETLTQSEQYRFAWVGTPDPETGRVAPSTAAGEAESYLEGVEIRYDDTPEGRGPAGEAIRTGEPQVVQYIGEEGRFEPWEEPATAHGFASVIVLPITFEEAVDSVLAIYATEPRAFDDTEREVLAELANTVGRALRASETRHRLVAHEQELERTNALLSTLFDALPVGVVAEGDDREVIAVNDRLCELFDLPKESNELLGADCARLAAEAAPAFEEPDAFTGRIEECIVRCEPVHGEEFQLTDGRAFARSYLPIDLPDGDGHLWVYWDVTERREHEHRLERQNERLDTFTSVVSHDLRNPLNVAEGHLELASEECDSEHLDRVESAHDRIRQLIEDLLTVAREGTLAQELEPVSLSDAAEQCWQTVETGSGTLRAGVDLTVEADEGRLKQLLENLFRNSVEYGSTGSRTESGDAAEYGGPDVTITIGEYRDGFYVADDGAGVPEDEREAVFEAGYSTAEDGTGFGLSIVRRIAEAHGWTVTVTESEDGGARFEFAGVDVADDA